MRLRSYKHDSDFEADKPWLLQQKQFRPQNQYEDWKQDLNKTVGDFKFKFKDEMYEKNSNVLRSIKARIGLKQQYNWEFSLRGDRLKKAKPK